MNYDRISKFISLVLRHKPEAANLVLDKYGYAHTNELIAGVKQKYPEFNSYMLKHIVETDEMQRYSFNDNGKLIRANQGHSIDVDLGLVEQQPPRLLFHGSSDKYLRSIQRDGIISKSRQYVHLSKDIDTAHEVGLRHGGSTIVYIVDAKKMHDDGYKFYLSENGVWLTDTIPYKYIVPHWCNDSSQLNMLKFIADEK